MIVFGLFVAISELFSMLGWSRKPQQPAMITTEDFDPALLRLTDVRSFVAYCDSIYGQKAIAQADTERYARILSQTLRGRFYHGYSHYSLGRNSYASLLAPIIRNDLDAVVIPDDILKFPMAACSQQSIIGMQAFRQKGITVRKVGFYAPGFGGHFCFEAFFENKWHFFDPDLEPKLSILANLHFPPIRDLVQSDSLLHEVYANQ
ncbi:MAG TPA: hypothetical protein VGC95_03365, partial [Chitinophagaceae bacterium]